VVLGRNLLIRLPHYYTVRPQVVIMRRHLLIACALSTTYASTSLTGFPETIDVLGDADNTHVQLLYDLLGGTFVLPF
jgi:hypothetical protein